MAQRFMEHFRFDLVAGPWWAYALCLAAALAISVFAYQRTNPPLTARSKYTLILLRSLGLACLIILLYEPIIRFIRSETTSLRVAVAVDVSSSMSITDKEGSRAQATQEVLQRLRSSLDDNVDFYAFDESLHQLSDLSIDSLRFNGFRTDIARAISGISNQVGARNYGGVVLITDGNHNADDAPIHTAEGSGLGVYSVGIGDTVPPRDIRASSILVSGIAVMGVPLPVTLEITQSNLDDGDVVVVFEDNGVEIARESVPVRRGVGKQSVTITWTPKYDGIRKVGIRILPVDGEFTSRNNAIQDFVTVRKDKRRVVLFAGAPSADVSFVKAAISKDPSVTVLTFIQKQGSEFYEGILPANVLDDVEAVILIGFPTSSSPRDVIERIGSACAKGRSLLFIPSLQTDYSKLGPFEKVLPFRVGGSRPQEFLVTPDVSRSASSDPILKLQGTEADMDLWNMLPPIYRTETFVEPAAGAVTLATIRVGSAPLDEPLLIKKEEGNIRSLALMGYGIYRWRLMGGGPAASRGVSTVDVLGTFLTNSLKWLSVRDDSKRVRIRSTHAFYAAGESVGIIASVQDQTYAVVDDADVKVVIAGASQKREIVLTSQGSGRYAFDIGPLVPGDYAYTGTVTRRGAQIGTDIGRFTVGDLGLEASASTRNVELLQSLAHRTGALSVSKNGVDELLRVLRSDPRFQPIARTIERELPLYHLPWLTLFAVLSFSAEWFLRKRRGLV
ncbi:MAG: VWA domain-containing protein [Candidatus Kapabacteria bacterium]|nr:VWA domain-containing protein [Candidatus Kapabacteria bacterium]